jgi:glycosyltransferase involved in cell wall biosynthesis
MFEQKLVLPEDKLPKLLVVGPLPPPLGGASMTFQIFCDEVRRLTETVHLEIIDSSAKHLKPKSRIISFESLGRAGRVLQQFCKHTKNADQVLVFGTPGFVLSLVPLLLLVAKIARKPFYVRVSGGSFDCYYSNSIFILRWLLLLVLCNLDGLIVQTELLYNYFEPMFGNKVHMIPGYRYLPVETAPILRKPVAFGDELRLIYLGHIKEEKGVFTLLDSLKVVNERKSNGVHCDLYGPIYSGDKANFFNQIARLGNATYQGVLLPENVVSTLRNYDLLVFPTHYSNEGHPGVLIEAMMAGIPVIATDFRSIPELIQHGVNGLLIAPKDPAGLAEAIEETCCNRRLLTKMANLNYEQRTRYAANKAVPLILRVLGIEAISGPDLTAVSV